MDNKLQSFLTFLPPPAAAVQLDSAFHHATTAYMCRRKDVIQQTLTVPLFSSTISPTLIGKTLLMESWFQRNSEKTFACRSDRPERKTELILAKHLLDGLK